MHLGAKKFHLVGLSMGGRVARNVALAAPERVRSLVLISTHPGFDSMTPDAVKQFVHERRSHTPQSLRRILGSGASDAAYQELLDSVARIHQASYEKTLEASVSQDRAAPVENITAPTPGRGRGRGHRAPAELAQELARRIPRAELLIFERTGHLANLEQPERFNVALFDFLGRQRSRMK